MESSSAQFQEVQELSSDNVEDMCPCQRGEWRRFTDTDRLNFGNEPMVFADFQPAPEGCDRKGFVAAQKVDSSQMQEMIGVMGIERDRFLAHCHPFFKLARIPGNAETDQGKHLGSFTAETARVIFLRRCHIAPITHHALAWKKVENYPAHSLSPGKERYPPF